MPALRFFLGVLAALSAVASAAVTPRTTCSTANDQVFKNGDFECGLFPWRALVTNGTTYWVSADHPYAGKGAFEIYQAGALSDNVGLGQGQLQQAFNLVQGKAYKLGFYTYQTASAALIGIQVNGKAVKTVDPRDQNGVGKWVYNEYDFTAAQQSHLLEFEFFTGQGSVQRIDAVTVTPAS